MANLKDIVLCFTEYAISNQLEIDKSTYFTVIIGEMTIFGILLTFYQFVASFQGVNNSVTRYLGINVTEYFVKKNTFIYSKIVSRKWFLFLFLLEILYKPVMVIYRKSFSVNAICVINFVWYSFAIIYFVIFAILFFQCTKSILMIKLCSDAKRNGFIIRDINKVFMKKTILQRINQRAIDLLIEDIKDLKRAIKLDDNSDFQNGYSALVYNIFEKYIVRKSKEISRIERKGRIVKNQVAWLNNSNCECHLLEEILRGEYISLSEENNKMLCYLILRLVKLNMKRALLEGCQKVSSYEYRTFGQMNDRDTFNVSAWKNLTIKIYKSMNDENKNQLVHELQLGRVGNQNLYKLYCDDCILKMIRDEIDDIFENKRRQTDFIKIFATIMNEEKINDFCSDLIGDKLISYNKFDAREIIKQLSDKNCTFLFSYIVMYYSLYKFRLGFYKI